MGQYWLFAGRSKLGAFPDSIPLTHIYGMVGARGQYRLCACTCDPFHVLFSTYSIPIAYIVCLVSFIDAWTKRILHRQSEVLHVGFSRYLLSAPVSADIRPCDVDGSVTGYPERDLNGEKPSISY